MQIASAGAFGSTSWLPYATTATVSYDKANKSAGGIYARFRDGAGNVSTTRCITPPGTVCSVNPAYVSNAVPVIRMTAPYRINSGAVVILSDKDSMKEVALNLMRFFEDESCGQCTPCREGTGWMWRVMEKMRTGNAEIGDIDTLYDVTKQVEGHTICALGDAAAWPIQGLIKHFRPEMERRIHEAKGDNMLEAAE
jgi:hypothetical protein